ncbi:MAG: hypothetical protein OEZ01_01050, partial [Candidatus Heimdallarchaeota archaeon]|nr:hypothetical protein [Candidatus Heimdallarchaeota archaeon]
YQNFTDFTLTQDNSFNINGMYMRINQFTNTVWNTTTNNPYSGATPPVLIDDPTLSTSIRINRGNNLLRLDQQDINTRNIFADISNGGIYFINSSLSNNGYFWLNGEQSGYHIIFNVTTSSFDLISFLDQYGDWGNSLTNSLQITQFDNNGSISYIAELEFLLTKPMNLGFIILFDGLTDGNLTITVEKIPIYEFPPLTVSDVSYFLDDSLKTWVVVLIVVVSILIIGVVTYLFIKKRKSGFE